MSMSDADARAIAVKALNESQVRNLHSLEEQRGGRLLPYEIANRYIGKTLRKHWGIPEASMDQAAHADRIGSEIKSLMKKHSVSNDLSDAEARINFDWHIHRSGIDFSFQRGATALTFEDPFESTQAQLR